MSMAIGYEGLWTLEIGMQIKYKAGRDDWRVEATATVTRKPGATGVYVQLNDISVKGTKTEVAAGDEVIAGANEVYQL